MSFISWLIAKYSLLIFRVLRFLKSMNYKSFCVCMSCEQISCHLTNSSHNKNGWAATFSPFHVNDFIYSERNHACGSSKHARICLACKLRSGKEKQVIGEIILPIMNCVWHQDYQQADVHVNYHIVQLTWMWHFGLII